MANRSGLYDMPHLYRTIPRRLLLFAVKEIRAEQLARADREMGARGLEQLARLPPVFAVRQKQARLLVFGKLVACSSP